MSSTAKITLQLLCSMIPDTGDRRVITLDELGALIPKGAVEPGEDPKFMSAAGVARVLTELGRLGQITTPEGGLIAPSNRLKGSLRIMPYRLPRHACACSRNAYDALDRLSGEKPPKWPLSDGTDDPLKDAQNSVHPPQEAQNSVREAHNSVREAQNSSANRGLTCDNAPTLTYFLPSSPPLSGDSSVPAAPAVPAGAVSDERGAAAPDNDKPAVVPVSSSAAGRGSGEAAGRETVQTPAVDVDAMAAALPGLSRADAADLAPLVAAAVAAGWTTDSLYPYLAARCDVARVAFPPAVYRKHLKSLPAAQDAAPAAVGPTRAELIAACADCDEYGYVGSRDAEEDGRAVATLCKHPAVPRRQSRSPQASPASDTPHLARLDGFLSGMGARDGRVLAAS